MSIRFKILGTVLVVALSFVTLSITIANIQKMRSTAENLRNIQQHVVRNIEESRKLIQESSKLACMSLMMGKKEYIDKAMELTVKARKALKDLQNNTSIKHVAKRAEDISKLIASYRNSLNSASFLFGKVNLTDEQAKIFDRLLEQEKYIAARLENTKDKRFYNKRHRQ